MRKYRTEIDQLMSNYCYAFDDNSDFREKIDFWMKEARRQTLLEVASICEDKQKEMNVTRIPQDFDMFISPLSTIGNIFSQMAEDL